MVAHTTLAIPEEVISKGMVMDEWWPLSGQEGHDKEGMIHIILSLQPIQSQQHPGGGTTSTVQMMPGQTQAVIPLPSNQPTSGQTQEGQQVVRQQRPLPTLSEEQLAEFGSMFPNIDKDVISSVFQENQGNQESTINSLLLLSGS